METVQIKIKSPSANIPDLEFKCDVNEKIIEIKRRISESYPTKPAESAQKLVYSGKILKDSDHLCNILRFEDECSAFTFHLVCSIPQKQKPLPSSSDGLRQRTNATSSSSNASSTTSIPEPSTNMHATNPMMEDMMRTFSAQYSQAMASMPSTPSEAEVMAMQQMYNQYLSLYMQYMQSQATPQPQQSQVLFQENLPAQNQFNLGEPHPAAAAPVAGEAAPNAAMVMNAGAAGQIQDDAGGDRNRDILDWVYVMTRVLLLFSVIYFHSSFLRLAFVAGLGFLVYLYQNRRNGRARVGAQNPQQAQAPLLPNRRNERPVAGAAQNPLAHPENEVQEEHAVHAGDSGDETNVDTDGADESTTAETAAVEEPKPSRFAVIFTFFTTLVSSIIPEQPQVV